MLSASLAVAFLWGLPSVDVAAGGSALPVAPPLVLAAPIGQPPRPQITKPVLPKKTFKPLIKHPTVSGMEEEPTGSEDLPQGPFTGRKGGTTTTTTGGSDTGDCYVLHMDEEPTGCE